MHVIIFLSIVQENHYPLFFLSKVKSIGLDSIHVLNVITNSNSLTAPIFMTIKSCQPASILVKNHTYFFIWCLAQPNQKGNLQGNL